MVKMDDEQTTQEHTEATRTPMQTGAPAQATPAPTPTPITLPPIPPTPTEIMIGNQLTTLAIRKAALPRFNELHSAYCKKSGRRLSKSEFIEILIQRFEVAP